MTKKLVQITTMALSLAMIIGCGGAEKEKTLKQRTMEATPDDIDPINALVGDVSESEMAAIKDDENQNQVATGSAEAGPDEDYIGGNQGVFLPTVKINNKVAKATYKVQTASDNPVVIQEGITSGVDFSIDPGTYDFVFTTKAIAGNPSTTLQGVEIQAGRRTKREVKFKTGQITLVTGARCVKTPIKIKPMRDANWLPGKYFTCKPIILMAGEYEAIKVKGKVPISGIKVYDGGIREILIRKK